MRNERAAGKHILSVIAVAVMVLAALSPLIASEDAMGEGADRTFYRYTINFTSTSTDTLYVIWDFDDGTVLDGRWEYYLKQIEKDVSEREVTITEEIEEAVEAYQDLLRDNGNSIYNPIHTFEETGDYAVTITAINPIGYMAEGQTFAYDGTFNTDSTGFDGGLLAGITNDTYDDEDTTVSGSWDFNTVTYAIIGYPVITFVSNGGSAVAPITVENTNTYTVAEQPDNPTKEGSFFQGWYADSELTEEYDWFSLVTEDITLYAKWGDSAIVEYDHKISYYDGNVKIGEQNVRNSSESVTTIVTKQDPNKDGFFFVGWATTPTGVAVYHLNDSLTVSKDGISLYAVWESSAVYDHKITFMDGTEKIAERNYINGVSGAYAVTLDIDNPSKDGFSFKGWATTATGNATVSNGTVLSVPTAGMTLYAVWEQASQPVGENSGNDNNVIPIAILVVGIIAAIAGFFVMPWISIVGGAAVLYAILELANVVNFF